MSRFPRKVWFMVVILALVMGLMACTAQPDAGDSAEEPADTTTQEEETATDETDAPAGDEQDEAPEEAPQEAEEEVEEAADSGDEESAAPSEPKILTIRLESDIENLDPAFQPTWEDQYASEGIMQPLVGYVPNTWDLQNVLAESIEQSEDGLSIEFTLKEGIQFHGGYGELTAEDVKFSYERIADPEVESYYSVDWETLDHVEVTGRYTGRIVLSESFAPLWNSTLPLVSSWVISQEAFEEMGAEAFAQHPIGTGPYEFVEWLPNERIVVQRFEDYWGEAPEWDEIHYLPIVEDSSAEIALETGEVDFSSISAASVERFEADPNFEVYTYPTLDFTWLALNVQHPNLEDVNVRRAVIHAIDVPSVIAAAYDGKWERACHLIAPGQVGHWEDGPCYEQDLEAAQEYLDAAGVDNLELVITVDEAEAPRAAAQVIQANLAQAGINAEIDVQDSSTFWEAGFGEQGRTERQLTYVTYGTTPDPSWSTVWFTCDQVPEWNWMYWCNERYDELHQQAIRELDEDARDAMYEEMQQLMDEDAIAVWIAHPTVHFAAPVDLDVAMQPDGRILGSHFRSR
ncbi:MAG TPA: ABC transporter substrate-binding protein [Candidatus Sulfomarinibacteraceae bacterium]|nr:ABC transporter substrate-binding protein [Candidatus Sulfomarinibacteraceae bacterium]